MVAGTGFEPVNVVIDYYLPPLTRLRLPISPPGNVPRRGYSQHLLFSTGFGTSDLRPRADGQDERI